MTTINAQPLSSITVPVNLLCAALLCASKEEARYYLRGLYFHRAGDRIRIASTDGHRIFIATHQELDETGQPVPAAALPEWLSPQEHHNGIILPSEGLKERLAVLKKSAAGSDTPLVRISYGTNQPAIVLESVLGDIRFTMPRVDGSFPDYEQLIGRFTAGVVVHDDERDMKAGAASPLGEFEPIAYNGTYLKDLAAVASQLAAEPTMAFFGKSKTDPTLITFPNYPGAVCYLMPMRISDVVAAETVAIISPAIAATKAALQAHVTRNLKYAKQAKTSAERAHFEARADEFKRRMEAVIAATSAALPKPEAKAEEPKKSGEVVQFPQKQDAPVEAPVTVAAVKITDAIEEEPPKGETASAPKPRRSEAKPKVEKKAKSQAKTSSRKRA